MSSQELLHRLRPIFCDVLDDQSLQIGPEDSAATVEGWDSLAHINLVYAIEQEFKVHFALGELQELRNVSDLIELLGGKIEAAVG